jgi:hypothetical protein
MTVLAMLLPRQLPREKGKGKGKPAAAAVAILIPKARALQARVIAGQPGSHTGLVTTPPSASSFLTVPGCVAVAASTYYGQRVECQSWLMDTGWKYDLTTRAPVPLSLRDSITDSADPITLHTANGLADCTLCVSQQIVGLHETVEPYILDSTQTSFPLGAGVLRKVVLSIGNRILLLRR